MREGGRESERESERGAPEGVLTKGIETWEGRGFEGEGGGREVRGRVSDSGERE